MINTKLRIVVISREKRKIESGKGTQGTTFLFNDDCS